MSLELDLLLEGNTESENRFLECLVEEIASKVSNDEITDDNPSPRKGETSLYQILKFMFLVDDENILDELKDAVYRKMEKQNTCIESEIDSFLMSAPKLTGPYTPDEEILRERLLAEIAKQVYLGEISDNNPSPNNGHTTLSQLIIYRLGLEIDDDDELERYRCIVDQKRKNYADNIESIEEYI